MARCKNGTRKNKKSGVCQSKRSGSKKRCPKGSRMNKKAGECEMHFGRKSRRSKK